MYAVHIYVSTNSKIYDILQSCGSCYVVGTQMDARGVVDFVNNSRSHVGASRSQWKRGSGGQRTRVRVRGLVRGRGSEWHQSRWSGGQGSLGGVLSRWGLMGSQCSPGQDPGWVGRQLGGRIGERAAAPLVSDLQFALDQDDAGGVEGSESGGRGARGQGVRRGWGVRGTGGRVGGMSRVSGGGLV